MKEREYQDKIKRALELIYGGEDLKVQWYPFRGKGGAYMRLSLMWPSVRSLQNDNTKRGTQSYLRGHAFLSST
jgi:hypothetical protein